jgi:PAS domain S-box-containing protein
VVGALLCLALGSQAAFALDPRVLPTQFAIDTWSGRDGLPEGAVQALIQSRDGYLWVATQSGVATFDGVRFTRQELPALATRQNDAKVLLESSDGAIWISAADSLARLQSGSASSYGEAQGLRHPYVYALLEEPGGCLWAGTGGSGLWCLRDGRFSQRLEPGAAGLAGQVLALASEPGGGLWVATQSGLGLVSARLPLRRFGLADGLPSEWVNSVYRDREGRLWVGTRSGLALRDGDRFVTQAPHRDPLNVRALVEDRDGSLWLGTQDQGLWRLAHGEWVRLDRAAGLADDAVLALLEDGQGSLWVGTGRGLARLRTPAFTAWGSAEGLPEEDVFAVAPSADAIWLGDARGALVRFAKGRFETVAPPGTAVGGVRSIAIDAAGSVWFSGLALHRFAGGRVTTFTHGHGEMTALCVDGEGLLLSQAREGGGQSLLRFEAGRFDLLFPEQPLPDVRIHDIRRGEQGRIWVSAEPGGLYRLGAGRPRAYRRSDGLPHDTVYGLHLDANGVWAATRGGLVLVRERGVFAFDERHGLPGETLTRLVEDGQGDLWVSGNVGVFRVAKRELLEVADGRQPRVRHLEAFGMGDGLRVIQSSWRPDAFARAADGRLWLAGARGVAVIDPLRRMSAPEPAVVLIPEVQIDERSVGREELLRLRAGSSRIAIRYTVADLLSARRLRFRHRLQGFEDGWVEAGARRTAVYTNLPPGDYTFRVEAQREPGPWGGGGSLSLRVAPLWYQRTAVRVLGLLAAIALAFAAHRLRIASLERRERELGRRVRESTEDLRRLNAELDTRVRARTAQLEEAGLVLTEEKERLAVTLASIGDAVAATDIDGRLVLMNRVAEALTGWPFPEARGKDFAEVFRLVARDTRQPLASPAAAVLAAGSRVSVSPLAVLVARDGREALVADSAAPIHDRESRTVGVVVVLRDVTDRTRADEQLQHAEQLQAIAFLAGGIAHDFNNLLTGIFGYVDLARRHAQDERSMRQLESALSVLHRARGLAGQLLAFTREAQPVKTVFPLGPLLQACSRFALAGSPVTAEIQVADGLWSCEADERQIEQVVDNLLINARQAMGGGGVVTIQAENISVAAAAALPAGRYVRLTIRDRGTGIAPEVMPRIFDPFFTTKPGGTGLGLATVRSIASRHGGRVDVVSEPDAGTTFVVLLPAAAESEGPSQARVESALRGSGRLLVMDDEDYVREFVREALADLGYDVEVASTGSEAIAAYERARGEGRPFDAVLLDLTVPGDIGGAAALVRLREIDPTVAAICSSGYSSDPLVGDPKAHGFRATLVKPYTMDELGRAVQSVLEERRSG